MRILVVEDNRHLAKLVCVGLGRRGFVSDQAHLLREAEHAITVVEYDAVILDIGLPDGDGVDWIRRRRQSSPLPPVLLLTARNGLRDRVNGLDAGADDYLVKPFEMDELAARLRAMLRRRLDCERSVIRVGALVFDGAGRVAFLGSSPLQLRRRECDFLEVLVRNAGTVVRRSLIEDALYGDLSKPVTPNAIEATASRLRRKLRHAGDPDMLVTIRGVGYLLQSVTNQ